MFSSTLSPSTLMGSRISAVAASVSSALAYMSELDDASIDVGQTGTGLVLDGTTPTPELRDLALRVARDLADCPVRDQIIVKFSS